MLVLSSISSKFFCSLTLISFLQNCSLSFSQLLHCFHLFMFSLFQRSLQVYLLNPAFLVRSRDMSISFNCFFSTFTNILIITTSLIGTFPIMSHLVLLLIILKNVISIAFIFLSSFYSFRFILNNFRSISFDLSLLSKIVLYSDQYGCFVYSQWQYYFYIFYIYNDTAQVFICGDSFQTVVLFLIFSLLFFCLFINLLLFPFALFLFRLTICVQILFAEEAIKKTSACATGRTKYV